MIEIVKQKLLLICIYSLFLGFLNSNLYAKSEKKIPVISLKDLVSKPKDYLNKKVTIEGEFHSFSSLSLDYPKALKDSKEYIGIILSRPDNAEIPLVELKLSAPLEMFKDKNISIAQGDKLRLSSKVYAVALGEAWLEVKDLELLEKAKTDD